jgi:hypothetical protein
LCARLGLILCVPTPTPASARLQELSREQMGRSTRYRRKGDDQTRSSCFREPIQRAHRRARSPAFQSRDYRLRCPHLPGQFFLGKTGAAPEIYRSRSQDELFLKRHVCLPVLRLFDPLLVQLRYACHLLRLHHWIDFARDKARRISLRGVFCVFFTNTRTINRANPKLSRIARAKFRCGFSAARRWV